MNLIGIKNRSNKQWKNKIYSKLEKLGFTHKPHLSNSKGYLIISPDKEFYVIPPNEFDVFMFDHHVMYEARNDNEFLELINKFYKTNTMETIFKKVSELVKNNEYCPLPLEVIPNQMGINLCSVDVISWQKQGDGQLLNLTIYFIPDEK